MPRVPLFFFFQAEDGIRDLYVTGVQTCALPICRRGQEGSSDACASADSGHHDHCGPVAGSGGRHGIRLGVAPGGNPCRERAPAQRKDVADHRARPCQCATRRRDRADRDRAGRSEEHTSELQSRRDLVCRLLLEKKKKKKLAFIVEKKKKKKKKKK